MHNTRYKVTGATLYVVGTPIGNLGDISIRAIDILKGVDIIAAEDTRVSRKLLESVGIAKKIISHHLHNEDQSADGILLLLRQGKSVALISDSGTPGISDPGCLLVSRAHQENINVVTIPGASALTAALSISGISAKMMTFHGFLPSKGRARKDTLSLSSKMYGLQVFFEAPHRLKGTVRDLERVFGFDRPISVSKELTKLYEFTGRFTLGSLLKAIESGDFEVRGEFVLVLEGRTKENDDFTSDNLSRYLDVLLSELPLKKAVQLAVKLTGKHRKEVYRLALTKKLELVGGPKNA